MPSHHQRPNHLPHPPIALFAAASSSTTPNAPSPSMSDHLRPVAIATHHVHLMDHLGPDVIAKLSRFETDDEQPRPYKLDSSDQKFDFARAFEWLNEDGRKVEWEQWVKEVKEGRQVSKTAIDAMDRRRDRGRQPRLPIRAVSLMRFNMSMRGYDAAARWIKGNGSVTVLEFCANKAPVRACDASQIITAFTLR